MADKKFNFLKSGLMGSSTMPLGTAGQNYGLFAPSHAHHHHHADGSCCDHDHGHDHAEHVHDENCNHDKK